MRRDVAPRRAHTSRALTPSLSVAAAAAAAPTPAPAGRQLHFDAAGIGPSLPHALCRLETLEVPPRRDSWLN